MSCTIVHTYTHLYLTGTPCHCVCRLLPAPGQGPSLEVQRSGYWQHELVALAEEEEGAGPARVVRGVCGDR